MPTLQDRDTRRPDAAPSRVSPEYLAEDPYVQLLKSHLQDRDLFKGDPRRTRKRHQELVRPYLDFFLRHDHEGFYRDLFSRSGLLNRHRTAVRDRVSPEDLYALRVTSDELRGHGQRRRLTDLAVQDRDSEEPTGKVFASTGTTEHPDGPVRIYRGPVTLDLARRVNGGLIDWALGSKLVEGSAMLYMPEQMAEYNWFAHLGRAILSAKDVGVRFGANLKGRPSTSTVWHKLKPDVGAIRDFVTDEARPKYLIGTTPSLHDLLVDNTVAQRALMGFIAGVPPIHLGRRGVVVLGGGTKDPEDPQGTSRELVREIAQYVTTDTGKGRVPAPVIDILGLTESASIFVGRTTSPLSPRAWIHYPHPLTYMQYLEGPGEPRPVAVSRKDQGDRERRLFYVNFACLDYLEAVISGDVVGPVYRDQMHQHGFVFRHRR
ncbi:MAG: hypothetical protein ACLFO1_06080 [Spirochaetaceae bacterium]